MGMSSTGPDSTGAGKNTPTEAPVATAAPSVPDNIFTGTLKGILGFIITQVQVLVDEIYDIHELVLY